MNDQGLFFDWTANSELKACPVIPGQMLPGDIMLDTTPSINELLIFYKNNENANDKLLETCKTVDEALGFYERYYEPCFGYAQLMLVDKEGNSAVLTWDWGKNELIIDRKKGTYQVIGVGANRIEQELRGGKYKLSAIKVRTLLEKASIDITRYSNIYNLKKGTVEIFRMRDFKKSVKFKLSDELEKGKANYILEQYFSEN